MQQFKKIVFFDAETTGLDPEKDLIIEGPGGFSREVLDIYRKKDNQVR